MAWHWQWDPRKDAVNKAKHGVSFALAVLVFNDPLAVTIPDPHEGELRERTIGRPSADFPAVLFVVHTIENEHSIGRIISARRATAYERKQYEEGEF
jgi:uncharacterized DUF497 family protein